MYEEKEGITRTNEEEESMVEKNKTPVKLPVIKRGVCQDCSKPAIGHTVKGVYCSHHLALAQQRGEHIEFFKLRLAFEGDDCPLTCIVLLDSSELKLLKQGGTLMSGYQAGYSIVVGVRILKD